MRASSTQVRLPTKTNIFRGVKFIAKIKSRLFFCNDVALK